jgi:hypothetical protein
MEQSWTTREHPEGFALDIPAGWQVSAEAGRVNVTGLNMERVTILPLKIETQIDANRARDILLTLCHEFWPQQRWDMPPGGWQFSPDGVRAVGSDESALREINALWWVNTAGGAIGFFYAVAAPPAVFRSLESVFARILSSFRVTRAGQPAAASSHPLAGVQFYRWTDPTEAAFTIEVPMGWRAMGGIYRRGFVGAESEFILQSPDGQVSVRSGDVNFPSKFITPNVTLATNGMWEGQYTSDGTLIMNYKSGLDFAAYYIQSTMGQNCQNLQWLGGTDRADRVQALAWYTQALGFPLHTAGEVTYSCQFGGRPYVGYQYAETAITHHSHLATLWNDQALYGFTAPPDRARLADAVLFHAINTVHTNPQWMMREMGTNARIAADNQRYRAHSAQLWQQTQEARWASWDRIHEQRGDILSNQTRVVDPQTGQAYKVESGSSYYWIDPVKEVIIGTNTPYRPPSNFHEVMQSYD